MVTQHDATGGHLDPEEVAEHAEGLLTPNRAIAVEGHLSSCARCQATAASISAVTASLAAAPREMPIPDGIATRIEAALASEAATREPAAAASRRERRTGFAERFWQPLRERMPAIATAAASIAVLAIIGYVVASQDVGGDDTDAAADSAGTAENAPDEAAQLPLEAAEESEGFGADMETGDEATDRTDDSAPSDEGAGEADAESLNGTVSAREREALVVEAQEIVSGQAPQAAAGGDGESCGTALAKTLGAELIGASETDLVEPGSVLVAIDVGDPDRVTAWVLPDCTATPDDAFLDFTAPRPE